MSARARLAVLISGNGSNLQAIIDAIAAGVLDAEVVVVISNRCQARGLSRARDAGIASICLPFAHGADGAPSRLDYDRTLALEVAAHRPDWVVLAGWMHVLSPAFLDQFRERVLNLHPALPGSFTGTHAIERAFSAFEKRLITHTGVMVHQVVPEVDAGPVLGSVEVPIWQSDTLEALEARIHEVEHRLLVDTLVRCVQDSGESGQDPQRV